jgi:hypothetical protein
MPIDYSRYPPNWKKEIVPAVLSRANNKCECCGLENKQTVYSIELYVREGGRYKWRKVWFSNESDAKRERLSGQIKPVTVVLTVAHLDHDETNHDVSLDRLQAMCQMCHLRYDGKEKYRRAYYGKGE